MIEENIVMYTVKEICEIFKCSNAYAYRLVRTSGFPSIKIGGKILTEKKALEKWIKLHSGRVVLQ